MKMYKVKCGDFFVGSGHSRYAPLTKVGRTWRYRAAAQARANELNRRHPERADHHVVEV